jgi:succinate dehydrogenase/fumarate reductase flavoprotein subunit
VLQHNSIPRIAELDVLVVGAGSAGCCAAIAAAELGRRDNLQVGLIERYGFAGGISTQTLDTFYGQPTAQGYRRSPRPCGR